MGKQPNYLRFLKQVALLPLLNLILIIIGDFSKLIYILAFLQFLNPSIKSALDFWSACGWGVLKT